MTGPEISQGGDDLAAGLSERLAFARITPDLVTTLRGLWPIVEPALPELLNGFYAHVRQVPHLAALIGTREDGLKGAQHRHWQRLFAGEFDDNYVRSVEAIGLAHVRVGLEPRWYIAGYAYVGDALTDILIRRFRMKPRKLSEALHALNRAIYLDMDVALSTYQNVLRAQRQQMLERLGSAFGSVVERAAKGQFDTKVSETFDDAILNLMADDLNHLVENVDRGLSETGKVLSDLASGDLTPRVDGQYEGAFARLKDDTNALGAQLSATIGKVRASTLNLKAATSDMLAGADDLSNRTTQQAATIEETSAAMEQLARTVSDNAGRARTATNDVEKAHENAEKGGVIMQDATAAMDRIAQSTTKISDIIGMIDDIAFQTNLLALNASVEAARAGDAGKGFAVVAAEVRRLAQSAAQASQEVKSLIEASTTEVKGGVDLVAKAAESLEGIVKSVSSVSALMGEIATASSEQATSLTELNTAMRQMDEATQQNAALVEQSNAAIGQAQEQSSELDHIVGAFRIAEGGPVRRAA